MVDLVQQYPLVTALLGGTVCSAVYRRLTRKGLIICEARSLSIPAWETLLVGLVTAALAYLMLVYGVQATPEVQPHPLGRVLRVPYHLVLTVLLLSAAGVDFRTGYIPDFIPISGAIIGVTGACLSGDLQVVHLWVDWNQEIPQLDGPYYFKWFETFPRWHGLAWSLAGLAAGVGLTWLLRAISGVVLGTEALGFGDVLLMGMAGAFLGWQPVVVALTLAPVTALLGVGLIWLTSGRRAIPYGPFLAAGVLLTMFCWRFIWMFELDFGQPRGPGQQADFALRRLFGDWLLLLMLGASVLVLLAILLGLLRWVKSIPIEQLTRSRGSSLLEEKHKSTAVNSTEEKPVPRPLSSDKSSPTTATEATPLSGELEISEDS